MKPTIIVQAVEKVSLALLASADRMADRAEKLLRTNIEQLESDLNQANDWKELLEVKEQILAAKAVIADRPTKIKGKAKTQKPTALWLNFVLPADKAKHAIEGLDDLYETFWSRRYGAKKALWIYRVQCLWVFAEYWLSPIRKGYLWCRKWMSFGS